MTVHTSLRWDKVPVMGIVDGGEPRVLMGKKGGEGRSRQHGRAEILEQSWLP